MTETQPNTPVKKHKICSYEKKTKKNYVFVSCIMQLTTFSTRICKYVICK